MPTVFHVTEVLLRCPVPRHHFADLTAERVALMGGKVIGDDRYIVTAMFCVPNSAEDPKNFFEVTRYDYRRAKRAAARKKIGIIGVMHTHLGDDEALPSEEDLDGLPEEWVGGVWWRGQITWYDAGEVLGTESPDPLASA